MEIARTHHVAHIARGGSQLPLSIHRLCLILYLLLELFDPQFLSGETCRQLALVISELFSLTLCFDELLFGFFPFGPSPPCFGIQILELSKKAMSIALCRRKFLTQRFQLFFHDAIRAFEAPRNFGSVLDMCVRSLNALH